LTHLLNSCFCPAVITRCISHIHPSFTYPLPPSLPPSTQVQKSILKGRPPLSVAPSAALAPADFAAEKLKLDSKWGIDATPEDVISSLLYPKVCTVKSPVFLFLLVLIYLRRRNYPDDSLLPYSYTFLPPSLPPSLPSSLRSSPTTKSSSPPTDPARASSPRPRSTTGWRSGRSSRRRSLCLRLSVSKCFLCTDISLPFFVPYFLT